MSSFLFGLNKSYYTNTDIKFSGDISENFEDVNIIDNVFNIGAIQYSIGAENNKFYLFFDHSKYIENNIDNNLNFEHTDGLNGLNLNYKYMKDSGFGITVYYPKTKLIYNNIDLDQYHLGGFSLNLFKTINFDINDNLSLNLFFKFGYLIGKNIKIKDNLNVSYKNFFFMISPLISIN